MERIIKPRLATKEEGDKWILPSPKHPGSPLRSVRGTFQALEKATTIRISGHDMRRTISTIAHNVLGDLLASRVLTHSLTAKPSIALANTARYVVSTHNEQKQGMDQIVRYILEVVEPAPKKATHEAPIAVAPAPS